MQDLNVFMLHAMQAPWQLHVWSKTPLWACAWVCQGWTERRMPMCGRPAWKSGSQKRQVLPA